MSIKAVLDLFLRKQAQNGGISGRLRHTNALKKNRNENSKQVHFY